VSCQRCDRFICVDCSSPGAIGFLCPEDARDRAREAERKREIEGEKRDIEGERGREK
jgi:hypothetical protein